MTQLIMYPHQECCFFIGGAIVTDHITHHVMQIAR